MARRREGLRVLGPYQHRRRWRILLVDERGQKIAESYPTESKARAVKQAIEHRIDGPEAVTVEEAIERYEDHVKAKGNGGRTIETTIGRLRSFFPDAAEVLLADVDEGDCQRRYDVLRGRSAVDTHRNTLCEVKTFLRRCVHKLKVLEKYPADTVEGIGKRRRGKEQLRLDEARRWLAKALELAAKGDVGAVAALTTLLLTLRSKEVVSRVARDVDDGGRLLWVPCSKTPAGRRTMEVPEVLRPHLARLAEGRAAEDPLFGRHDRGWPNDWVQRICRAAGVPTVCAHGLRGTHATIAEERGVTPRVVARALGHESPRTTHAHYTRPEAVQRALQRRALRVLQGGRK